MWGATGTAPHGRGAGQGTALHVLSPGQGARVTGNPTSWNMRWSGKGVLRMFRMKSASTALYRLLYRLCIAGLYASFRASSKSWRSS